MNIYNAREGSLITYYSPEMMILFMYDKRGI